MTLPARPLSAGLRVTGSPPLALGTRAFTCLELAQHAVRVEGCTPPPQSCHPGPPWNGVSSYHRVRAHLPQQPCPFGLQQTGGRPSPRPLPSALWLCCGRCSEHCPCPRPREPSGSPPPPTAVSHRRALCPSGTLGHTLYRLPCPHTQSVFGQLTLLHIHRRTHPHPLQFQSLTQRWLKLSPELRVPTCPDDGGILSSSWEAGRQPGLHRLPCCPAPPRPSHTCRQGSCLRAPTLLRADTLHVLPERLDLGPRPPYPVGGLAPNFTPPQMASRSVEPSG